MYFTLVTVEAEPMDMDMVTLDALNDGIAEKGRVAIYDIYFDTGKSEVKEESSQALAVIANYLKQNKDKKFLVVGHTDNTGDFDNNIELSQNRAKAVADILATEYEISEEHLLPYGIGSTSPVFSNTTEEGKARNRRVEIVER
ncbi:MAG: OmpA family protein [Bacteroidales bacterium]